MALKQILKVWDHEFKPNEQSIMLAMADHANEDGTGMWPSNARLAHKTGYSLRNVKRIKKALRKKGVLIKVEDSTHNRPTEYRFDWSAAKKKKPFTPKSEGGHSVENRGDKGGHSVQEGGHSVQTGVTASSPEPSVETVKEPREGAREAPDFSFLPSRDKQEHLRDIKETFRTVLDLGNGDLQVEALISACYGRYRRSPQMMRSVKADIDSAGWPKAVAAHTIAAKKDLSAGMLLDQWEAQQTKKKSAIHSRQERARRAREEAHRRLRPVG